MGSKSSSQPVLKTEVTQKIGETSQLSLLPEDVLIRILKFLDIKTLVLSASRVCKYLCQVCGRCPRTQHLFLGYMGHIYEQLMFSKGVPIPHLNPDDDFQPCYFRPNVNFSLEELPQPVGMVIHIFTISDSKEIRFNEIVSMVIELPNNAQGDIQTEALRFLKNLAETPLGRLRNLRLSGFLLKDSLFASLSKFSLDWLHLILPVFVYRVSSTPFDLTSVLWFTRLHMKLREDCNLPAFQMLPRSLKEFSLHVSNLVDSHNSFISLHHCTNLEKM